MTNDLTILVCVCVCAHAQSCPTPWDPMDCSLPGSSVHGIFQARILEWVAVSYSRRSSRPRDQTLVSCISKRIVWHCAHSCLCKRVSIETQEEGVQRASGLVNARPLGSMDSRVALTPHALSPYLVQRIASIRLWHISNLRRQIFLWVLEWSSKLIKLQEGVPDSNLNQDPLKKLSVSKGNHEGYFKDSIGE